MDMELVPQRRNEMSETKRYTDKGIVDDSSPITVGGGGGKDKDKDADVRCKFKDGDYPEAQGSPAHGRKKFRHGGWKIKTFGFSRNGTWEDHSDLLPNGGNCTISISCEGDDDDVDINGDPFGIDMNPDTYQNEGGGVHTNPNADSFIFRVVLTGAGQILGDWPFDQDDDCEVCTDHVEPDQSTCGS